MFLNRHVIFGSKAIFITWNSSTSGQISLHPKSPLNPLMMLVSDIVYGDIAAVAVKFQRIYCQMESNI